MKKKMKKTEVGSAIKYMCAWCGKKQSGVTYIPDLQKEKSTPSVGDPTVCIKCSEVSVLDANGEFVRPNFLEYRLAHENYWILVARLNVITGTATMLRSFA
jgi:hypothetical protein